MSLRSMLFGAANGTAPLRRSCEWLALRRDIAATAGLRQPPRSWQQLYRVIHERPAPRCATWEEVLGDITPGALRTRWHADTADGQAVTSWNLRWLVAHDTRSAAAKRAVIVRQLERGRP
eukprot:1827417-Alexandrium_andersonii.AAC.1